jgi:hypothetical protein
VFPESSSKIHLSAFSRRFQGKLGGSGVWEELGKNWLSLFCRPIHPPLGHLHWSFQSRHGSGGGGSAAPMGSLSTVARRGGPRPPKSQPSPPRGSGSCVSQGATGPGARRPTGSRSQSVTCAPPVAKRPAWGPPQPSARGRSHVARSLHHKTKINISYKFKWGNTKIRRCRITYLGHQPGWSDIWCPGPLERTVPSSTPQIAEW